MYLLPDGRDELTERETPLRFLISAFGMVSVRRCAPWVTCMWSRE